MARSANPKRRTSDVEAVGYRIVMAAANTMATVEIQLASPAIGVAGRAERLVYELLGWQFNHGIQADDPPVDRSANLIHQISTQAPVDADATRLDQNNRILYWEHLQEVKVISSANGDAAFRSDFIQGMPQGMFQVPIPVAADRLFASLDTTDYAAASALNGKLFLRPVIVSQEEYFDILETFR